MAVGIMRRLPALLGTILSSVVAVASAAAEPAPLSLTGPWKFRTGDDPAWASPQFDDRGWSDIAVPTGWGPVGYNGPKAEVAWYRKTLRLAGGDRSRLGLAMGPVDSAYELYIGGRRVGEVGALPPEPSEDYDRRATFPVPPELVGEDGRVVIAVRVWTPRSRAGGLYDGPILLGPLDSLARGQVLRELPLLVMSTAFAVIGLSHLSLRWRGREHAWFGAMSVALAAYTPPPRRW